MEEEGGGCTSHDVPCLQGTVRHNHPCRAALHGNPRLTSVTHVTGGIADVTLSSQESCTIFSKAERKRV